MLSTAVLGMKDANGKIISARVVLDSGSQSHFITKSLVNRLKIETKNLHIPIEGFGEQKTSVTQTAMIEIHSNYTTYHTREEFLVINRICGNLPNEPINRGALNIPANIHLADPEFHRSGPVEALLGQEIVADLGRVGKIQVDGHKANLLKTALGWVVAGRIGPSPGRGNKSKCMISLDSLDKRISKFWEVEELAQQSFLSPEEQAAEEFFLKTTSRDDTGRYIVRLPFNNTISKLGESMESAKRQFFSLERKLSRNENLRQEYIKGMREAQQLGHMREYNATQLIPGQHCFLPHHAIIKESSTTTKVRIVYNASHKTSTGISLNECQLVGPVVQSSGFDILLRFRTHQIAMAADIEKMYKQVRLDERDIQFQLIFWREHPSAELKVYTIPVVLFGNASAPYCATRVIKQLTLDERDKYPLASVILRRDCYVDDVISGTDTTENAMALRDELIQLAKSGGFNLRKWISNDSSLSDQSMPQGKSIQLVASQEIESQTLGLRWNRASDTIFYKVQDDQETKITKRGILSAIARLYDPIGLLGPVITSAKIIMQQLWKSQVGWDEAVTPEIYTRWIEFRDQLSLLNLFSFSRKVIVQDAARIEIHGFCDASEKSYGACVYIRSVNHNGEIGTNLLCSKGRVAPLKVVTLPKLEVCGALILPRLVKNVIKVICKPIDDGYLCSDSAIAL